MQESLLLYFDVFKNFASPKGERKITVFELNPSKLNEVLEYYNILKATKISLEKI